MEEGASLTVTSMAFLDPYPLLAVACSDGGIRIWAVWSGVKERRGFITCFYNQQPNLYIGVTEDGRLLVPSQADANPTRLSEDATAASSQTSSPSLKVQLALSPVPVLCMTWSKDDKILYSGDECGRIRRWSFKAVFVKVDIDRLITPAGGGRWMVSDAVKANTTGNNMIPLSLVVLEWSREAHENAVLSLELANEPRALLSSGSDQCAKMWTLEGKAVGTLIQGLPRGMGCPGWDLPFDVKPRQEREDSSYEKVTALVMGRLQRKRRSLEELHMKRNKNRLSLAPPDSESIVVPPPPVVVTTEIAESNEDKKHTNVLRVLDTIRAYEPYVEAPDESGNPKAAERKLKSLHREMSALPSLNDPPSLGIFHGKASQNDKQPTKALLPMLISTYVEVPDVITNFEPPSTGRV